MTKIFQALNYLMAILFAFAAVVQYNDPDGLIWIGVYGLASALCFMWLKGNLKNVIPLVFAVITLVWAIAVFPGSTSQELFGTFSMQTIEIEEMRESLGLTIITIWMTLIAFIPRNTAGETESVAGPA